MEIVSLRWPSRKISLLVYYCTSPSDFANKVRSPVLCGLQNSDRNARITKGDILLQMSMYRKHQVLAALIKKKGEVRIFTTPWVTVTYSCITKRLREVLTGHRGYVYCCDERPCANQVEEICRWPVMIANNLAVAAHQSRNGIDAHIYEAYRITHPFARMI